MGQQRDAYGLAESISSEGRWKDAENAHYTTRSMAEPTLRSTEGVVGNQRLPRPRCSVIGTTIVHTQIKEVDSSPSQSDVPFEDSLRQGHK